MPPEQVAGNTEAMGPGCDIYSLGVVLYQLLTNRRPFQGDLLSILNQIATQNPKPPSEHRAEVDSYLDRVCLKALAKRPEDRFNSMAEFAAILGKYLKSLEQRDASSAASPQAIADQVVGVLAEYEQQGRTLQSPFAQMQASPQRRSIPVWVWATGGGLTTLVLLTCVIILWKVLGSADPNPDPPVAAEASALQFNGKSSYVEVENFDHQGGPITIELIVRPAAQPTGKTSLLHTDGLSLQTAPSGSRWVAQAPSVQKGDGPTVAQSQTPAVPGERAHVAAQLNGNELSIFVNGKLEKTVTLEGLTKPSAALVLGAAKEGQSASQFFSGSIEEVRVSGDARYEGDYTPTDRFESDEKTMALYHVEEGEGDVLRDASGNGRDGKIVGAEWLNLDDVEDDEPFEAGFNYPLAGILPAPAEISGVKHWQIDTVAPRGAVKSIDFSPDGRLLACGSYDRQVRVFELQDGHLTLMRVFSGHESHVNSVAWSPNGRWIASAAGSGEPMVRIWDYENGKIYAQLEQPGQSSNCVCWSPDSKRIAVANEKTVQIWNVESRTQQAECSGHEGGVFSVTWHPTEDIIASASSDGTVRLWNLDGSVRTQLDAHKNVVNCVQWSPDGTWLASGSQDMSVRLWSPDGEPGPVFKNGLNSYVITVAWSKDSQHLACNTAQSARIFGLEEPEESRSIYVTKYAGAISSLLWSSDDQRLAVGGAIGIRLLNISGSDIEVSLGHSRAISDMDIHQKAEQIVTVGHDGVARFWKSDGTPLRATTVSDADAQRVAFNTTDDRISASGRANGKSTIRIWSPQSNDAGPPIEGHDGTITSLAWNSDGKRLATANRKTIRIWSANDSSAERVIPHEFYTHALAWSPSGDQFASVDHDLFIWNSSTGNQVKKIGPGSERGIMDIAWKSDEEIVLVSESRLFYIDPSNANARRDTIRDRDKTRNLTRISFPPDKERAAIVCNRSDVVLLNTKTAQQIGWLRQQNVSDVGWIKNGENVISADRLSRLTSWNAKTGAPEWVSVIVSDTDSITFTPEGQLKHGDAEVIEKKLVYIVEHNDGRQEIMLHSKFQKLR